MVHYFLVSWLMLYPNPYLASEICFFLLLIGACWPRLPFYSYFRLFTLSYLVLPQTQGARLLYQSHIHPFLAYHEAEIDNFITHAHNHARAAGLSSLKRFIDFVKENILGLPPKAQPSSLPIREGSYAQNLLSRFNLPSARQGFAAPAGDFYGLLSAALGQVNAGGSREAQMEEMSRSGTLIPRGMTSAAEKITFLSTQRERLRLLLNALDKEASELSNEDKIQMDVERRLNVTDDSLRRSRSEAEFEAIEKEEWSGDRERSENQKTTRKQSWMPWGLWETKETDKAIASGADRKL